MGLDNEQKAALYGAWDAWTHGEMRDRKTISEEGLMVIYKKEFEIHVDLKKNELVGSYLLTGYQDGINGEDRKIDLSNGNPLRIAYDTGYKFGEERMDLVKEMSKRTSI